MNAVEIAKAAEAAGAAAVAVHGRTREQFYSGKADWAVIREVKKAVRIPVIGNGDVTDGETARCMMEETGCDGIMIGRAAKGNPWIFREVRAFLENGEKIPYPRPEEVKAAILRHADLQVKYKGEYTGIREMRKHIAWYTAGYPNSARFRGRINEIEDMEKLKKGVEEIFCQDMADRKSVV